MMLALATGWTPDVLVELPLRFRAACHWMLYARTIIGDEGLNVPSPGAFSDPAQKQHAAKNAMIAKQIREALFPEDDDGDA